MIERDAAKRPTSSRALDHPFLWSGERRLQFLMDASDALEALDAEHTLVKRVNGRGCGVFKGSWEACLEVELLSDLGTRRKYDFASLLHLLRAIRNKKSHYYDLPDDVMTLLGDMPLGYLS